MPNPSHSSHAPLGLLKENILGSSSCTEKLHLGHECLFDNRYSSSAPTISTLPFENLIAVSIDSVSLCLQSSVLSIINWSTKTDILCFLFFSSKGTLLITYIWSLILTLEKPSAISCPRSSICSPFPSIIMGEKIDILLPFSFLTVSATMATIGLAFSSKPWSGHFGIPTLAKRSLK